MVANCERVEGLSENEGRRYNKKAENKRRRELFQEF